MNKFWIPTLLLAAVFSANAFAHDYDEEDDHYYEHRHVVRRVERVVVYDEPDVVYQAPPVRYRERIVYRDRPVYVESAPDYYERPAPYPGYYVGVDNRAVGQTVGAIAGGVLGHSVGRGGGRIASTAVGAVLGSIIGGNLAGR